MSPDDKKGWYHAAWLVLEKVPADLLRRGVAAAMEKADHPSRIVSTIMANVKEDWDWRRKCLAEDARIAAEVNAQVEANRSAAAIENRSTGETTAEILARVWPTMENHAPGRREGGLNLNPERECRQPTKEDYLRMGVPAEHIDRRPSSDGNPPRDNA